MNGAAYLSQPYVRRVIAAMAAGDLNGVPGTTSGILILHDDWCDFTNHRGPCNCDPDLEVRFEEVTNGRPS